METKGGYIQKIEVSGLWGIRNLVWNLNPEVNILSGINGSGKSTIIREVVDLFRTSDGVAARRRKIDRVRVTFDDGGVLESDVPVGVSRRAVDVITTFDSELKGSEALQRLSDGAVRTDLDWDLYQLQKRFLSYQLMQGKRAITQLMQQGLSTELASFTQPKEAFYDLIDGLFGPTGKLIDRGDDELSFQMNGERLTCYQLSSGEKQMLLILATVLTEDQKPYVLLMDEPEISLHFDWQQRLIEYIRELNPQVQLIMTTHSPAVIMNGWLGHVTEINDLIVV